MPAPLAIDDAVIAADTLSRLRAAPRDVERESRALDRLVAAVAADPARALAALTDLTVDLVGAGSAGVSLIEGDRFFWPALAGSWAQFTRTDMSVGAVPCGSVIARDRALLFTEPRRIFPDADIQPPIREALLVPLRFAGKPTGTLWAVSHDDRRFDAEDARLLERLALFAGGIEDAARSRAAVETARTNARQRLAYSLEMIRSVARRAADRPDASGEASAAASELGERMLAFTQAGLGAAAEPQGADLYALVADTLLRHAERPGERVDLSGPDVVVSERAAGIVGLALREIVDNAFRHGALGKPAGRASAEWHAEADGATTLVWTEHGAGLALPMAVDTGFGFDLLRTAFAAQTGGAASIAFTPGGITIRLTLPTVRGARARGGSLPC